MLKNIHFYIAALLIIGAQFVLPYYQGEQQYQQCIADAHYSDKELAGFDATSYKILRSMCRKDGYRV